MSPIRTRLHRLRDLGRSAWVDYLSRTFVRDGELAALIRDGVAGVTSAPTIFQGAIADSDVYDAQLTVLANQDVGPKDAFLALAREDIRAACDELRPVWDHGAGRDGWVSLEVDPHLAYDTDATVAEATRLHAMIERPNRYVKIPATEPGLAAIEETIAREIPVNVTLCFSIERHRAVCEAYLSGLRRLRDEGGDLRRAASVASFFVSRVDTEADRRLDEIGGYDDLRGTLAIANAKLAYRTYEEVFAGDEWSELAAMEQAASAVCGHRPQRRTRPIATSATSKSSSGPRRSTRSRARPSSRSSITARSPPPSPTASTRRAVRSRPSRRRAGTTTMSRRHSSVRASSALPTPSTSCSPTSSPSAASWPRESVRRPPATLDGPRLVTTRCARARTVTDANLSRLLAPRSRMRW
jgi:transaldolase